MKSVILFNKREMTYAVVGMNYTEDEAAVEVEKTKNLGGFHVDQEGKTYESEAELEDRISRITNGQVTRALL